jgi:hypothetical protein
MSRNRLFILVDKVPVPINDCLAWARWMDAHALDCCQVAREYVGTVCIATDFLGINYAFGNRPDPILFETMVFGGPLDMEQLRYGTWSAAKLGHEIMVRKVIDAL